MRYVQALLLVILITLLTPGYSEASVHKIGFTGDWEHGKKSASGHKDVKRALGELQKAVNYYNTVFYPQLVVAGGDYIEGSYVDVAGGIVQMKEVAAIFNTIKAKKLVLIGNHDVRSITKADFRAIFKINANHAIHDFDDLRVATVDLQFDPKTGKDRAKAGFVEGFLSKSERAWLKEALKTDKPVIVFTHQPPVATVNHNGKTAANVVNAVALRALLEDAGNVVAVVSGHVAKEQFYRVNGIGYFVNNTLVNKKAMGSFGAITVDVKSNKEVTVTYQQLGERAWKKTLYWKKGSAKK